MGTSKLDEQLKARRITVEKAHKKLALPLWVKLRHSEPEERFDVLLTLNDEPRERQIRELMEKGLEISEFHRKQPSRLLPGIITRQRLETELVYCECVRYIEGLVHYGDKADRTC